MLHWTTSGSRRRAEGHFSSRFHWLVPVTDFAGKCLPKTEACPFSSLSASLAFFLSSLFFCVCACFYYYRNMASSPALPSAPSAKQQCSSALLDKLTRVLPQGHKFLVHHLSTPPTRTDALTSPPPGARPDRTYRESHFLAISIEIPPRSLPHTPASSVPSSPITPGGPSSGPRQVLVLGLEIFIFTIAWSSTFFVSKADSTGYLHLLNLPKGTPSPIREISTAFISYLVEERRRDGIQSVVSLFARAQNQYLFPGSVDNKGKHVLDDRGLVRWWCRVLNSMMEEQGSQEDSIVRPLKKKGDWESKKAYLVVPGLDLYESRVFLPRTPNAASNWVLNHPLERISHFAREYDWVPPRCLVPKFPDDPKSRFRDELDLEASKSAQYEEKGLWHSVQTLDQFWEMMAFRQECSGGHMTGFLWVVLEPHGWSKSHEEIVSPVESLITSSTSFDSATPSQPITPPRRRDGLLAVTPKVSPLKTALTPNATQETPGKDSPQKKGSNRMNKKKTLSGPIKPRLPRVKKHARNYVPNIPITTPYYCWPPEGRGTRIVAEADYKRSIDLLTKLDFETLDLATGSSKRWINEVGGGQKWALEVVGRRQLVPVSSIHAPTINNMGNLARKPQSQVQTVQPATGAHNEQPQEAHESTGPPGVTMLIARKKPKAGSADSADVMVRKHSIVDDTKGSLPLAAVNVLTPRKKRKDSAPETGGSAPTEQGNGNFVNGK